MAPADLSDPGRPDISLAEAIVIVELAERRLRRSTYSALGAIRCEYRDGSLILQGQLPSNYLKQAAQECVSDVVGVREVDNRIEVVEATDRRKP